ncbi:unnamed protein product, partial [Prorocentrum cordatum]
LLPLQALPPPAGGGGPGEQRSPAEIARAALRAPGGGDSTRRGVGGRVRSEGATGGWGPGGPAAGARRARSPRPAGVALRAGGAPPTTGTHGRVEGEERAAMAWRAESDRYYKVRPELLESQCSKGGRAIERERDRRSYAQERSRGKGLRSGARASSRGRARARPPSSLLVHVVGILRGVLRFLVRADAVAPIAATAPAAHGELAPAGSCQ